MGAAPIPLQAIYVLYAAARAKVVTFAASAQKGYQVDIRT